MEDHMREVIFAPISKFMRENILYMKWSPDFTREAPTHGRQSEKFHLNAHHEICPHFYANPFKDYYNLCWDIRLYKQCIKNCPDNTCLAIENTSLNLGSFKVGICFAFEKENKEFCHFQYQEIWMNNPKIKIHKATPKEPWKTIHLFLEYLPNLAGIPSVSVDSLPPLSMFLGSTKTTPPFKFLKYLYDNRVADENCITIVGSDGELEMIHEEVLKRSSPVFERLLKNNFSEREEQHIYLPQEKSVIRQIVHYLYFGHLNDEIEMELTDYMNLCMFFHEHEFLEIFDELKCFVSKVIPMGPIDDFEEWCGTINWLNENNTLFPHNFYFALLRLFHLHIYINEEKGTKSKLTDGTQIDIESRIIKKACEHSEFCFPHNGDFYCGLKL